MEFRKTFVCRLLTAGLAVAGCVAGASAQQQPPPVAPAQFDPSDLYFKAYLEVRAAEELEAAKDFIGAMERLRKADEMFETVRRFYPEWKPQMVGGRRQKTVESIERVRPDYEQQMRDRRSVVAELEGGERTSGTTVDPGRDVTPLTPGILEVEPLAARQLKEARAEVERLRKEAANGDVARQNDFLKARLRAAETNVESLRARLAAAPMEKEMQALNKRIESLEQEREAMGLALGQSRSAHTEAMARIATLEADLQVMRQKYADLDRNMKKERDVANDVVAGQRRQMEDMEKALAKKDKELVKANQRISQLVGELEQSREAFAELRDERDNLLRERDQMAALLKLNEASRIQDLIEQNMALAKNLREANEKVDRLNRESNADKDAYTEALRDLAIAKTQINSLRDEKIAQEKRLAELEARLKSEENALATGATDADPAEVAVLRDIIQRQLRIQERRRQARDLLVEAAKDLGKNDDRLAKAIDLFDAQEIALSPEEMKLVAGSEVDGEFIAPTARDRESVGQATADLNRDIQAFERTAERSFVAGRLLPSRELYQMILEQNPGHTPALCKLGVVQLKLGDLSSAADAFRRAVELDSGNPYAHRMLGFALMQLGELPAAEQEIRRATELAPTDARSLMLLATACYRLGRIGEAESYFKAAITADPMRSEAYYNLAVLCQRDDRIEDARRHYQKALELGALPDPDLEEKLANQ